jgi:hypothetical protein
LIFSLDAPPEGAEIDSETGLFIWTPPDGPLVADVTVRVTDDAASPLFDIATFKVTVENVPPDLTISGDGVATVGVPYELFLDSYDPGDDTITNWTIDWGDGNVTEDDGNADSALYTYTEPLPVSWDLDRNGYVDGVDALGFVRQYRAGRLGQNDLEVFASQFGSSGWGAYQVTATATDEDGTYTSNTHSVLVLPGGGADQGGGNPQGTVSTAALKTTLSDVREPLAFTGEHPEIPSFSATGPEVGEGLLDTPVAKSVAPIERVGWQWQTVGGESFSELVREAWGSRGDGTTPFEYKSWEPATGDRLVDLSGGYDEGDTSGETREEEPGNLMKRWLEHFVIDFEGLEDPLGVNSDIRVVLSDGDVLGNKEKA